jgi:NAD(P)-dependent dehydrogenase (short-subunit alcohol dehydrogenase family)
MNRIAIVTGGAGVPGNAICKSLADQGRHVVSTYREIHFDKARKQ